MNRSLSLFAVLGVLISVGRASGGMIGYDLQVETTYQFGSIGVGFPGEPDTGFFRITNAGASTFTGTISDLAISAFGSNFSYPNPGIARLGGLYRWARLLHYQRPTGPANLGDKNVGPQLGGGQTRLKAPRLFRGKQKKASFTGIRKTRWQ